MAKVNFVGFQEKVEIPEGFELLTVDEVCESSKSKDELFSIISDSEKISQWFINIVEFDSRPGGKINYSDNNGNSHQATCTSFVLGKEVSMVADAFGNYTAKVEKNKGQYSIKIRFAILTDDCDKKSNELLIYISQLKKLLA